MIKRLLILASLALSGYICLADDAQLTQPVGPFGGLNTNISQEALDATQSPDLLNVDISLGGKSVKKRQGYGLDVTLAVSTSAVHNLYKFFDSSGNEVRLAFNDNKVSSSINGATWSTILSTGTIGATWDCTDYLGYAYCVSSAFDNPIKTNGTTAGTTGAGGTNAVPAGSLVSNSGDRLLVGATAANPSRLYYSASAVFSDFSLGVQSSNSSYEDIVAPGSKLTHLAYHYGRWLWWKDQSFGFIVGTGQFDLNIVVVSNTVGTLDNTDVFDNGITYFRGSDAQIYTYDGSNLSRAISTDIAPTLRSANRRKSNQWVQTTGSDFNSGSAYATFTDSTSTSGSVTLPNIQGTAATLTSISTQAWGTATLFPSSSTVILSTTGVYNVNYSENWIPLPNDFSHRNVFMTFNARFNNKFGFQKIMVSVSDSTSSFTSTHGYSAQMFNSAPPLQAYAGCVDVPNAGSASGNMSGTIINPNDTLLHRISLNVTSNGQGTLYADGISLGSGAICWPASGQQYLIVTCSYPAVSDCELSDVSISLSTGVYYSAVDNAANITTWSTFNASSVDNGGSHSFFVRSSTNSFAIVSSTPNWTNVTPGGVLTISTGTYFQMKDSFTVSNATSTPTLNDFTFNWVEGSASDKMYGTYFNNGIWFSLSLGTATVNNRILRYDLLSSLWTLYDIPANGFATYNNNLYFAGPSTGCVFQFGQGVTSDNGSAINAYWKSKPFFGDSPFTDKDLRLASWYISESSGTTLTMTYTLNESTAVTKSLSLFDSRRGVIQNNWNFPLGSVATNFNVQFGDNSTNPAWEVFGGAVMFTPRPWKVSLQ